MHQKIGYSGRIFLKRREFTCSSPRVIHAQCSDLRFIPTGPLAAEWKKSPPFSRGPAGGTRARLDLLSPVRLFREVRRTRRWKGANQTRINITEGCVLIWGVSGWLAYESQLRSPDTAQFSRTLNPGTSAQIFLYQYTIFFPSSLHSRLLVSYIYVIRFMILDLIFGCEDDWNWKLKELHFCGGPLKCLEIFEIMYEIWFCEIYT